MTILQEIEVVILGAGITGLSASKKLEELGIKNLILEKSSQKGGHLKSFRVGDIEFDEGPHILFSNDNETLSFLGAPDPKSYEMQASVGAIYRNRHMNHPAYLHFSSMRNSWLRKKTAKSILRSSQNKDINNYQDWVISNFGKFVNRKFTEVYTQKYWRVSNKDLGLDWINARIHQLSQEQRDELLYSNLSELDLTKRSHYLTDYTYSSSGFFSLFPELHDQTVMYGQDVVEVDTKEKRIKTSTGEFRYNYLVSTIPLDKLSEVSGLCGDLANQLYVTSIFCSSLVFKSNTGMKHPYHWVYVYDRDTPISRVSFPSRFSAEASGKTISVQTEEYFMKNEERPSYQKIETIVGMLKSKQLIPEDAELITFDQRVIPYANIVPTLNRAKIVSKMKIVFEDLDIYLCGRFGSWQYLWSVESALSGIKIAERIHSEVENSKKQTRCEN